MYDLYINKILFPVAPSKITTKINNNNKTITLINGEEINILKDAGLTEFSFDLLLPNTKYYFANYLGTFRKSKYYLNILENLKLNKKVFVFTLCKKGQNGKVIANAEISTKCAIEDYSIKDDVSEGTDIVVTIKLKQYRAYGTKLLITKNNKKKVKIKKSRDSSSAPETNNKKYVVKKGDTLFGLAKKYYGDGSKYIKIYNANKNVIEATAKKYGKESSQNGHWIYVGEKLIIP